MELLVALADGRTTVRRLGLPAAEPGQGKAGVRANRPVATTLIS